MVRSFEVNDMDMETFSYTYSTERKIWKENVKGLTILKISALLKQY